MKFYPSIIFAMLVFCGQHSLAAGRPERAVYNYIAHTLKVDEPERFMITDKLRRELELGFAESSEKPFQADGSLTPAGTAALLTLFSEVSAENVANLFLTLGRPQYPNSMLIGLAGVGKTFTIKQLTAMLSFGVVPEYLKSAIGLKDSDSEFLANLRSKFFSNTQIVSIDYDLLSQDNTRSGGAFAKADVRMRALLIDLCNAAKKDFQADGLRTIFVMEEVATLPPLVQTTLKTMLDHTGFKTPSDDQLQRGSEVGYSMIGLTTPNEYRDMVGEDSATERRYHRLYVLEPGETEALGILSLKKEEWFNRYDLLIDDDVLAYIISMRKFFNNPPLAMPDSILKIVNDLLLWCTNPKNRKHNKEITIEEAYEFLVRHSKLPLDTWIPKDQNKAPLWDLAQRVKSQMVGQDAAIDKIARRLKTGRATGFREVQVYFIMGPSGSGKDTMAKAFNRAMFGHDGHHLKFELGGENGNGLRSVLEKSADDGLPLLLKAMDEGPPNGIIVFNEAKDMPNDQFESFKIIIEDGIIRPRGRDTRERPLGINAIFIMGQYGEELFEGKTAEESAKIIQNISEDKLIRLLQAGSDNGRKGAVPYAVIQRAIRSGGLILLQPVPESEYASIIRLNLKEILKNLKVRANMQVDVDETLVQFISDLALANKRKTRALDAMLKDLTETAISESQDQGLPMRGASVRIHYQDSKIVVEQRDKKTNVVIKNFAFDPTDLLRSRCETLLDVAL